MYALAPDEKATTVMVYSRAKLIHGNLVTKSNLRVNIWLRTQGVPNYIHLLKTQVLFLEGASPKSLSYDEYFFPTERIIAFHLAPPNSEPLDYDPNEANRAMVDVNMFLGVFLLKGKVRVSTHADLATSIEVAHMNWLSVYDAEICNLIVSQMPAIRVPMLLVDPRQASFGL